MKTVSKRIATVQTLVSDLEKGKKVQQNDGTWLTIREIKMNTHNNGCMITFVGGSWMYRLKTDYVPTLK